MNQDLLTKAITFFKEQHGTYAEMRSQMLAGGFSEADITQVYSEVQRLGLDKASPMATQAPAVTPVIETAVQSSEPGTFTLPTVEATAPTPEPSHKGLILAIIGLFIVLAIPAGVFAYVTYNPLTSLSKRLSNTFGIGNNVSIENVRPVATTTEETTLVATSTLETATSTEEWKLYRNAAYGFTLTFPEIWKGYRTQELPDGVWFGIQDQDQVFGVVVFTKKEWADLKAELKAGGPLPDILGEDSTHVFVTINTQDPTPAVLPLLGERTSIFATFTLPAVGTTTATSSDPNTMTGTSTKK